MIETVYHGTNAKIEYWSLDFLGSNNGQSVFPGIYFTKNKDEAMRYAKDAAERKGGEPRVYIAEVKLDSPINASNGMKYFSTFSDFIKFLKEYFPKWFDENRELKYEKTEYVNEKFSTYQGQWNLIKFAAEENDLDYIDVVKKLGFDSCIDGQDIATADPNNILSFQEIFGPDAEQVQTQTATETIAERYLMDSRKATPYKTMPGNRFKRRMMIKTEGGARIWYDIDVNRFFRKDEFTFHIPVIGESDDYIVEFQVKDWIPILRHDIKDLGFSVQTFKKSLAKAMRMLDIKCHCTCPDFKFRFAYWFTMKGDNSGEPETRPAKITNSKDDLGRGCKHILFTISLKTWAERIGRILFNYCFNLYKQNKPLFKITIGKKLEITDEMVENRPIQRRKPKQVQPEPDVQEDTSEEEPLPEESEKIEQENTEEEAKDEKSARESAGRVFMNSFGEKLRLKSEEFYEKNKGRVYYHGTSEESARKILSQGFKFTEEPSWKGDHLGKGIYLSTKFSRALDYASNESISPAVLVCELTDSSAISASDDLLHEILVKDPAKVKISKLQLFEFIELPAKESYYSSYYRGAKKFDEEQRYMIDLAADQGIDVLKFVTPENGPEQIWEVARDIQEHLPEDVIYKLANPDISIQEHQVLREAYLKGVDLFEYMQFDADILKQLYLAAKQGLDPKTLALPRFNARQIEQIRMAMAAGEPYEKLLNPRLNYNDMKKIRLGWKK